MNTVTTLREDVAFHAPITRQAMLASEKQHALRHTLIGACSIALSTFEEIKRINNKVVSVGLSVKTDTPHLKDCLVFELRTKDEVMCHSVPVGDLFDSSKVTALIENLKEKASTCR